MPRTIRAGEPYHIRPVRKDMAFLFTKIGSVDIRYNTKSSKFVHKGSHTPKEGLFLEKSPIFLLKSLFFHIHLICTISSLFVGRTPVLRILSVSHFGPVSFRGSLRFDCSNSSCLKLKISSSLFCQTPTQESTAAADTLTEIGRNY